MHRKAVYLIPIMVMVFATSLMAEDKPSTMVSRTLLDLLTPIPSEQQKKIERINLSTEDDKLAFAISEGSFIAYSIKKDLILLDYQAMVRMVKYCRWRYNLDKPDISFVKYIANFINNNLANCENWVHYYEAFL